MSEFSQVRTPQFINGVMEIWHTKSSNLWQNETIIDLSLATILVMLWYYMIVSFFFPTYIQGREKDSFEIWREKRLAWIMTLLSAIVECTVVSIYCYYIATGITQVPSFIDLSNFDLSSPEKLVKFFHGSDRLSSFAIRFFCTYLLIDTIYMILYYKSVSNFQSWLHHIGYFVAMGGSLYCECPMIFLSFMPIEFSTIFLGSGHIWPNARQDLLFGVSFFLLRVLYHGLLISFLLINYVHINYIFFTLGACGSWLMHLQWFGIWFRKYRRGKLGGKIE